MSEELSARAADGVRLAISVTGSGPTLLMIPGLGSSRAVYDPVVPLLARRHRVVVYDQRGIGDSGVADGPYTMEQLAADADCVLDAVGCDTCAVFGASMGGMVAQHVAINHDRHVDRLILACTTVGGRHATPADPEATRALLGRGARTPGDAYRMACTVLYSRDFQRRHPEVIEAEVERRARRPVRARVFRAQFDAVKGHDTHDRLGEITVPALVLHGTEDAVMPIGNGETLAAGIPGARSHWFDGRGHLFFHEDPQGTAAVIEDFLAGEG